MKVIGVNYATEIPDAELSGRLLATLARNGQVKSDDLQVFVEKGEVTLLGTVDTPYERSEATRQAYRLPGVKRVDNRLTIAIEQYLSDRDLLDRVQVALIEHPLLARYGLGATINRGVVTLLGRINTLAEERAAVAAAERVKGVRRVVSRLKIGQIDPTDQPVAIVDDATLLSEVNAVVFEAGVIVHEEDSYVRDGVAYLRGKVDNRRSLHRALAAAEQVPSLQAVRNELILQANVSSRDPDEALAGRVIRALHEDPRISPAQIVPVASWGVVRLSGQVDSIETHDRVLAVAAGVPGVRRVVDDIRILGRTPLRADDRGDVQPHVP